ncbi:hypothetical protein PIB30_035993 [Stylosanthes scabra]|uniref:DUF4283 domain-containing protein n=1 Tax=Stylosanthes scabra TaxID=79078 RepID=A0ABU6UD54_9FABA|nr:hypothetical protein [Stylosanthes scabra]
MSLTIHQRNGSHPPASLSDEEVVSLDASDVKERWNKETAVDASKFCMIPMWIQLWEMPDFCKTKEAATKIGEKMGSVIDVDLFDMKPNNSQIMKVRVEVDISTTLRQSISRNCDLYLQLSTAESEVHLKWRADLRADKLGWRISDSKENINQTANIAGSKRAHDGKEFEDVDESILHTGLTNAAKGEGANPHMAPKPQ